MLVSDVRKLSLAAGLQALLLVTSAIAADGSIRIDGIDYVRAGSMETLTAPLGGPGQPTAEHVSTASSASYSGYVEVVVSGTGQSLGPQFGDAFYVFKDGLGRPITPFNDPDFYQLAIDTAPIRGGPESPTPRTQLARELIVYDYASGAGKTPPFVPAYRPDHRYRFVIDVSRTDAWSGADSELHFTVANGIYVDNSGAFHIELYPLMERIPGEAVLLQAAPSASGSRVSVQVSGGTPGAPLPDIEVLTAASCSAGTLGSPTTTLAVLTGPANQITGDMRFDDQGNAFVVEEVGARPQQYAAARLLGGSTASPASRCIVAGPDNDAWTRARTISLGGAAPQRGSASGFVDLPGRARWYKFAVQPDARVQVTLSGLPADYDLVIFGDIAQAFEELADGDPSDVPGLDRLGAEFAPSVLETAGISPFAFSPSEISPFAFSPFAFSPFAFSPSVFAGDSVAPFAFSPFAFSPSATARSDYSPFAFSPFAFSPFAFSPFAFSAENYSSAQSRSVIAVSAQAGRASEQVSALTWSSTGEFYVRVAGKNGTFDDQAPFTLDVSYDPGLCEGVFGEDLSGIAGAPGNYQSIILYDSRQLGEGGYSPAQQAPLIDRLEALAARSEVAGVVVDLAAFDAVQRLQDQSDLRNTCPHAVNLTAGAIKRVIDAYWAVNPDLRYVVLAGNDAQIPFFRYPDQTLLGPEQNYDPPMADFTQSQAALRLNYVLGQDEYGAGTTLNLGNRRFPVPQLAVGRLVETPAEMITVLDAYLATSAGVVSTPTSTLVTGYDFLADAAGAIQAELAAGVGGRNDTLITPAEFSPDAPQSWNADALRSALLGNAEDIIFLAGHFNAFSALAADFETSMQTTELIGAGVDLTNALIFSAGCHSGYNAVNEEIRPDVALPPDWAQAFARKGATLVAGTGYQYGDTEFIEFGERLYLEFVRRLRSGNGPVSVGEALVQAKQIYLQNTPDNKGLHSKTVLISTVFGLPMLRIDMPGSRLGDPGVSSPVRNYGPVAAGTPGAVLGLESADLSLDFGARYREMSVELSDLADPALTSSVTASYLQGPGFDLAVSSGEPVLPLESVDVGVPGTSLRGVGFRGGDWSEEFPVIPLDGAATTELRAPHTRFASLVNFPMRLAVPNYYGRLAGSGATLLHVTPVQHRVQDIGGPAIRRRFVNADFELFYSGNTRSYGGNRPALSAAPTLSGARVALDGPDAVFEVNVVGDPSAGIQSVWVTYTDGDGSAGSWVALDLEQDPDDSRVWRGRLTGGANAFGRLDVMFHAVNGVGLVTTDDNFGSYYQVTSEDGFSETALTFVGPVPAGATAGSRIALAAALETAAGNPVTDATVLFKLGTVLRSARTDSAGVAEVELPVQPVPSSEPYPLVVSFNGNAVLAPSSVEAPFRVSRTGSRLTLTQGSQTVGVDGVGTGLTATLTASDPGRTPLQLRTVYFTVKGTPTGDLTIPVATDFQGVARLGELALPSGRYRIEARFLGMIPGTFEPIVDPVYLPAQAVVDLKLNGGHGCPAGGQQGQARKGSDRHHWNDHDGTSSPKGSPGDSPKRGSKRNLQVRGFCYLNTDVGGDVHIKDGTLIVGGSVDIKGNVHESGPGSVVLLSGSRVHGHVKENFAGDLLVDGRVSRQVMEKGPGDLRVGLTGMVDDDLDEDSDGSVIVAGEVRRNVREQGAGDVVVQATGRVGGSVDEHGDGTVIVEGVVGGRVKEHEGPPRGGRGR